MLSKIVALLGAVALVIVGAEAKLKEGDCEGMGLTCGACLSLYETDARRLVERSLGAIPTQRVDAALFLFNNGNMACRHCSLHRKCRQDQQEFG
jgi:hypothetical protein